MLHAVSLKPLCVQGLKTPHQLHPCDPPLSQIAISMATEANGPDVHMATAAVGTEDGGGRRRRRERGRWGRGVLYADALGSCLKSF